MRFTEHEMTQAVRGAALHLLTAAAERAGVCDGFDAEQVLDGLSRYERFQVLDGAGDFVLPVLVALPDVDVEPGTRPTFTLDQTATVVGEVTRVEAERHEARLDDAQFDVAVATRLAVVSSALDAIPVRVDPDGLLKADDLGLSDFTVPDTIEGI